MDPIKIILSGVDDASDEIKGASNALDGLASVAGGALSVGLAAAAAGLVAVGAGLVFSVGQALDAEKGQARLAQVLKSTGGAAGLTQDAANALAQQFMNLAGGSDDAVLAIEEIGLRAGTISANEMPAFIQSTLDLGAVLGDTASAATLLARAQEDPLAAMGKLQKAGIVFTDALKDQIKELVKNNDVAGATALIMGRVAEATGGAAAANAGTLAGQWEILKGQMGEAFETIGTSLLPVLHELFDTVIKPAIPIVTQIAEQIAALIMALQSGDMTKVNAAFANLGKTFSGIWEKVKPALEAFMAAALAWVQSQIPVWLAQLQKWGEEFVAWVGPQIPPLLSELGKLGADLLAWVQAQIPVWIAQLQQWGREFVAWVAPQIPPLIAEAQALGARLLAWLGEKIPELVAQLLKWGTEFVAWIGPQVGPMLAEAGKFLGELTAWLINTGIPALIEKLKEWGKAFIDWVSVEAIPKIGPALNDFLLAIGGWIVESALPALVGFGKSFIDSLLEGLGIQIPVVLENLKTLGGNIVGGIKDGIIAAAGGLISAITGAVNDAIAAAKLLLGIHSPSTVFAGIGANMMSGMAMGITGNAYRPAMATAGAVTNVTNNYNVAATYGYQSEGSVAQELRLLSKLRG